jgi:hypothetical protein
MPDPIRSQNGTIGAHVSWGRTVDRSARTAPARSAFDQRFLDEADGDPIRANHLRKAYFLRLAAKSVTARRKAREHSAAAEQAETELASLGEAG